MSCSRSFEDRASSGQVSRSARGVRQPEQLLQLDGCGDAVVFLIFETDRASARHDERGGGQAIEIAGGARVEAVPERDFRQRRPSSRGGPDEIVKTGRKTG